MAFVIARLKNKITYFNKLGEKPVTAENTREMDKVEGMFFITECKHRKSDRVGDRMVHICAHDRLHGANC